MIITVSSSTKAFGAHLMAIVALEHTRHRIHHDIRLLGRALQEGKDGTEIQIEFDVIYFLQDREGKLRIFSFITGDEEQAYRDHGLAPA